MSTLTVGQGQQFATIGAAVAASRDGDVLQVQAGTYTNDFATINTKITLQGVGGMVHVTNTSGWGLPGDKGLFVTNTDVTFDHFEISGAEGSSGNAAGIRYQAGNLMVTNSYFHDNENGILANPNPTGTVTIQNSEFAFNGNPNGSAGTHNIYIGDVAKLTIDNSYFHDMTNEFNQIKSRAAETVITNSRILDLNGNASYEVDIPNGGKVTLANNFIQQGVNSGNIVIVGYGAEGITHSVNSLTMTDNTFINEIQGRGILVYNPSGAKVAMSGNDIWKVDWLEMPKGSNVTETGTTYLSSEPSFDTSHPHTGASTPTPTPTPAPTPTPDPTPTPGPTSATSGDDRLTVSAREVHAAAGNDTIDGAAYSGPTYLRGDDGDDSIRGGLAFDDINGNMGADTAAGGLGDDWVVGGKDNDRLSGDAGGDLVYGNLGNDTALGGDGGDIVRGGQNDDIVVGGAGDDYVSGDRGSDTVTGGAGADRFHTFGEAGVDRVTDFNASEGDRVMLDPGAQYAAAQVGADTVITITGGGQMILANVQLSTLSSDWIYVG